MKRFFMIASMLCMGSLLADETYIQDENGTTVQIEKDGSKTIKKADGTIVQVKPDGSKLIKTPEGTTIQIDANGKKQINTQ